MSQKNKTGNFQNFWRKKLWTADQFLFVFWFCAASWKWETPWPTVYWWFSSHWRGFQAKWVFCSHDKLFTCCLHSWNWKVWLGRWTKNVPATLYTFLWCGREKCRVVNGISWRILMVKKLHIYSIGYLELGGESKLSSFEVVLENGFDL